MKKVIVIGGGAAGMMAAITAAREGAKVTIFERNDRVGKKILQTGNGKCNLGNRALSVECYHGTDLQWIGKALERFDTEDTIRFFQSIGNIQAHGRGSHRRKPANGVGRRERAFAACERAIATRQGLRACL